MAFLDVEWSPTGEWLAYVAGFSGHEMELFLIRPDGGESALLATGLGGTITNAVWSPTGTSVAFARRHADGSATPYVIDVASRVERQLADPKAYEVSAEWACDGMGPTSLVPEDWSADGTKILLAASSVCLGDLFADVVVVESTGGSVQRLGGVEGLELHPDWSPDARSIVIEGPAGLIVFDLRDGTTKDLGPGLMPAWNSASTEVAAIRSSDHGNPAAYDVWTTSLDSAQAEAVEASTVRADAPEWSPSGGTIAFLGSTDGKTELYLTDVASGRNSLASFDDGLNVMAFDFRPAGGVQ